MVDPRPWSSPGLTWSSRSEESDGEAAETIAAVAGCRPLATLPFIDPGGCRRIGEPAGPKRRIGRRGAGKQPGGVPDSGVDRAMICVTIGRGRHSSLAEE